MTFCWRRQITFAVVTKMTSIATVLALMMETVKSSLFETAKLNLLKIKQKKATAEAEPTVRESATDNAGAEQEAVKVSRYASDWVF
mmetsp:Transcript_8908/g.24243  ORF Transcript_8908/g.24243 Transcript_8908/m.24243 type:complete len:86 (+) Transcript_8908:1981-2238(+)